MFFPVEEEDLKQSQIVPVFPLSNGVLLPYEPFPLHVFEERYKQMMEMALSHRRLIVLANQRPDGAEIYPVAGLGKIVWEDRFTDGRFNLLLVGLKRIKINHFVQEHPFRMAEVELLEDHFSETTSPLLNFMESELLSVTNQFLTQLKEDLQFDGENPSSIIKNLSLGMFPLGVLTDMIASFLPISSLEKQMVLEETDVIARCQKLTFVLKTYLQSSTLSSATFSSIH